MWRDECLVLDMLVAACRAITHTEGLTLDYFRKSELHQDATLKALETIGEAANQVGNSTKVEHPEIPWRRVINFRKRDDLAHSNADLDVVWDIVKTEIPTLEQQLSDVRLCNATRSTQ